MHQAASGPLTIYLVKQLESVTRARLDEALRPFGLSTPQFTALTSLRHRGGLTSAQLSRRSFVTPQSMHELLRTLRNRGFISARRDPDNGRIVVLDLSPRGLELLAECDPIVQLIEDDLLNGVETGMHDRFRAALAHAIGGLDSGREPPAAD